MKPPKNTRTDLSIPALEVLEFAADNNVWIVNSTSRFGPGPQFDRKNPAMRVDLGKKRGIVSRSDIRDDVPKITPQIFKSLVSRKFINALDKHFAVQERDYFSWCETPWEISDLGYKYLEENRQRLADARRQQAAAPEELIVVARQTSDSSRARGIGDLCRIVRRTDKRVYVEVVEQRFNWSICAAIHGRDDTERYVDVADVVTEVPSREIYAHLVKIDEEYLESMKQAKLQLDEEITPIQQRYLDREKTLQTQLEDDIRNAVGEPENGLRP